MKYDELSFELLYNEYILNNMTFTEIGQKYNIDRKKISKRCKELNIIKEDIKISKDILYDEYIIKNKSQKEISDSYNIPQYIIQSLCVKYNLKKSKEQIRQCIDETNIKKYGSRSNLSCEDTKEKIKKTNLEKYGHEYATQNKNVKEKTKQTNLKKYGVECVLNNDNIQNRIKQTNLVKYGVDNPLKNKDIQDKAKQTIREKYGVSNISQLQETQEKIKNNNLQKYGVASTAQLKETQEKRVKTNLHKYGVEYPLKLQEFKNKLINTNLNKYGCEYTSQNENVKEKAKQTNLEKYGKSHYLQKFTDNHMIYNKETFENLLQNKDTKWTISELSYILDMSHSSIGKIIHKLNLEKYIDYNPQTSIYELELREFIEQLGINKYETNFRINNQEIDIYLPEYHFGIEFNGSYWHSEIHKTKNYHKNKSDFFEEKGIFIYHIFEYEWLNDELKNKIKNQIKNILQKNKVKIYARKCEIREVSSKDKSIFLKENHLQGNDKSNINLGLYYNDELVSIMTFTKPRFNKKYTWELSRFCSKADTNVIGSASKLFKYFSDNYLSKNENIISYSNVAKTKGNIYKVLNFDYINSSTPNYVWWMHTSKYKTRYQTMMINEAEIMHNDGYVRIYDCGNKVWVYKKN